MATAAPGLPAEARSTKASAMRRAAGSGQTATFRGEGVVVYRGPVTRVTYVFEGGVPVAVDARDAEALGATGWFTTQKSDNHEGGTHGETTN